MGLLLSTDLLLFHHAQNPLLKLPLQTWIMTPIANHIIEHFLKDFLIISFVHFVKNLLDDPVVDGTIRNVVVDALKILLLLLRVPLPNDELEQTIERLLHMHLYRPEFLIAIVLQNLTEEHDLMVLLHVQLDAVGDGHGPLDDETFQPILFVEVGVDVLLHGLSGHLRLHLFRVKSLLLRENVSDQIF